MAIIFAPNPAEDASRALQTFLQMQMAKEQNAVDKERLKIQQQNLQLAQQQQQMQQAEADAQQMSALQQFLGAMQQPGPQTQQALAQPLQALGNANVPSGMANASVRAAGTRPSPNTPSRIEAAQGADAGAAARTALLDRVGRSPNFDDRARERFTLALDLDAQGMDASVINSILPPDEADLVALSKAREEVRRMGKTAESDRAATAWLKTYLPDTYGGFGDEIPGAVDLMDTLIEVETRQRLGEKVPLKDGIDIAERFFRTRMGSGLSFDPTAGKLTLDPKVTMEQAYAETVEYVRSLGLLEEGSPSFIPGLAEALSRGRLSQRALERNAQTLEQVVTLYNSLAQRDPGQARSRARDALVRAGWSSEAADRVLENAGIVEQAPTQAKRR